MNKSRLVHLGLALVVVMLLVDAALVYRASLRFVANDRRVAHTQAVLTQFGDALDRLDSVTADNPGRQARTAAVRKELGAKVDELEETVRLRRRAPACAAAAPSSNAVTGGP